MDSTSTATAKPITVSSYGPGGASTRVRLHDWLAHLGLEGENYGFLGRSSNPPREVLKQPIAAFRAEARLWRLAGRVSQRTLLLGREATPFGRGGLEAHLLSKAGHGIYDYDDALYVGYPRALAALLRPIDRVWQKAVRAADIVIAGSEILAEPAEKLANEVVVIPSCIEPSKYLLKSSYAIEKAPRAVWLGSPSTEPYLAMIAEPLLKLHRELGLRLTLISAGNRSHGLLDAMTDRVQWSPEQFATELTQADLGIMPLPDDEWARGKCAYKLLQYAAAGLPTVGSAVGANISALSKVSGTAVHVGDDWADAIRSIIELGETQRASLGAAARTGVVQHFSYGVWAASWRAATGL
ncbi:hypothetical protein GCM10022239_09470 [Leifsonia bigeumensis]|uniref:Glycosyltransferase n=1 Tax=Leifsonella bigeumensis TaxID=433643 RepID=A0ABP7FBQ0_9MICO